MMRSIIICEGGTDLALIQYFMEKVNEWHYDNNIKKIREFNSCKNFKKGENELIIAETGGCTKIANCFDKVFESNTISSTDDEFYNNVVIICDRDELSTVDKFKEKLCRVLLSHSVRYDGNIIDNKWISCDVKNARGQELITKFLLLAIPFEETGALETFLLQAISKSDDYDAIIIEKGNNFVDNIDEQKKYLNHRRYITKAKFDVFFSIRTSLEQFTQRREILKNVPWEQYENVQESFKKLRCLG